MKQIFHPYYLWEDYRNGFWRETAINEKSKLIQDAMYILINESECERAMRNVIYQWPRSTEMNLSNREQNRRSWLGQAACCIQKNVPEDLTRIAWNQLTDEQKLRANKIAEKIIKEWESENSKDNLCPKLF